MPAKKKSSKTRKTKAAPRKASAKKPVRKKPVRAQASSSTTKAPKPGVKEEHYADLRRVALANALARLR